jgi:predicted dehydrogenase
MKKVRMAILGAGPRGQCLGEVYPLNPQLEIVAVCDYAQGLAEGLCRTLQEKFQITAQAFTDYEEMARSVAYDALFICSDPDCQVEYACDAMRRGIHVMTEVPAAYTLDQCRALVDTVRATGAKYQLAEQTRYWSFIRHWREMAAAGELGQVYYAEGEYLHYEPAWDYFVNRETGAHVWTADPAYFQDPAYKPSWRYRSFQHPIFYLPHELSPLLSITGGRIDRVSCMSTPKGSMGHEGFDVRDMETALMHNSNGVIFSLRAGFTVPFGPKAGTGAHWYQVKGSKGCVEWSRSTLDQAKHWSMDGGWQNADWTLEEPEAEEFIRNATHGGADYYPIDAFVNAILNDTQPPMDVYRAVETAAPAILAAQSAEQGGTLLEVPDFRA